MPSTEDQLMSQLDFDPEEMLYISAKTGQGVDTVFKAIIESLPPPPAPENEILKAFLFDARYVPTRGVACLIKVMSGCLTLEKVKQLMSFHNKIRYQVYDYGIVQPNLVPTGIIKAGQVGYFISNMKQVSEAKIGDTFFVDGDKIQPYPGYEMPQSVVFAGIYPEDPDDYEDLEKALQKLCLTDSSV